jgi:hypothetical protein
MALIYVALQHNLFLCNIRQKARKRREMFFLFPFVGEPAVAPALGRAQQYMTLPLLPQPHSARAKARPENGLADAVSQAGSLAVELLKRALSSMTSSLTALGNHANALFSQVAAALAYERMARETASFLGAFWPGFAQPRALPSFAGPWIAPAGPPLFACFGLPQKQLTPALPNPWGAFTEAFDMWTSLWAPAAAPQRRHSSGTTSPVTATFGVPGFTWSFTLG